MKKKIPTSTEISSALADLIPRFIYYFPAAPHCRSFLLNHLVSSVHIHAKPPFIKVFFFILYKTRLQKHIDWLYTHLSLFILRINWMTGEGSLKFKPVGPSLFWFIVMKKHLTWFYCLYWIIEIVVEEDPVD